MSFVRTPLTHYFTTATIYRQLSNVAPKNIKQLAAASQPVEPLPEKVFPPYLYKHTLLTETPSNKDNRFTSNQHHQFTPKSLVQDEVHNKTHEMATKTTFRY